MSIAVANNPNRIPEEIRQSLFSRVGSLHRRSIWIRLGAALLWGVVAAMLSVMIAVWFDLLWDLSATARIRAMQIATGCGGLALLLGGWLGFRHSAMDRVARSLDSVGRTGGEIVAGLNLAARSGECSAVSAGLAEMAVERATTTAGKIAPGVAVPLVPVSRPTMLLCGMLAVFAAIAVFMPGFFWSQWNRFASPYDDVPPFTRMKISVQPGDVEIVYGDGIEIIATTSETPVDDLQLVLRYEDGREEMAPMFSGTGNQWRSVLTRVTEPVVYHAASGRARSERFRLSLMTIPEIERVEAVVDPPEYTRQAVTRGPIPTGGLSGLAGTEVTLQVSSNRPLKGGEIRIASGTETQTIPLNPMAEGSETVSGSFSITANGKFLIQIVDVDGQASRDNLSGSIELLEDYRPFVRIASPQQHSLATPTASVPLVVEAEDDYGITSLQVYRSLNDSVAIPKTLNVAGPTARHVDRSIMSLAEYQLKPGDEIKLFARAEDNDPAGAKGSESPVHVIQIISQESFDAMQRQQQGIEAVMAKYRHVQRELEKLAAAHRELEEATKQLDPDSPPDSEAAERVSRAAEATRTAANELRNKLKQEIPIDVDDEINDRLKLMAKELDAVAMELDELARKAENGDISAAELQEAIAKIKQKMGQQQGDFDQQIMQPMNNMAQAFKLIQLEYDFVQLVMRQRDLADRAASLKEFDKGDHPESRRRLREYAEEQGEIYEMFIDVVEQIEDRANELPDDPEFDELRESALEFARTVAESGADTQMEKAELAFAIFSGVDGHRHAEAAAKILEEFLSQCEGMGQAAAGACKNCFSPSAGCPNPGNSLRQLAQMFGLGRGQQGMGDGAGGIGGYSQRRSTANNIGLYGSQPLLNETSEASRGDRQSGATGSLYTDDFRIGIPGGQSIGTEQGTGGSSAGTIPARYERRTGQYFRRLAEESGN